MSLNLLKKTICMKEVRQLNDTADCLTFIKELTAKMDKALEKKRFSHTLAVATTASCMAMRYDCDANRAYIAGLLHDNAKCLDNDKKLSICKKYNIPVNDAEAKNPDLLHAKVGSILAKEKYKIEDEEIISSIRWHTTGKPNMTALEKIIYIADYIEPLRKKQSNMDEVRKLAFTDLDACMMKILAGTIQYLTEKNATIDQVTMETYQFYKQLCEERK